MSSFDQSYDFEGAYQEALSKNPKNTDTSFQERVSKELQGARERYGEKSQQYRLFQRSVVEYVKLYNKEKHDIDRAFSALHESTKNTIRTEIAHLQKDVSLQDEYRNPEWYRPDMHIARLINVKSSILENLGDMQFDFQGITPEKRREMESRAFTYTKAESWKETGILLGEEFANSIKDIALFFGSIPGSILMIPEYIRLRSERNTSMKNEAKLALMVEEFPALALLDLSTDWDKGGEMLKTLAAKFASGTQGDVAFAIINVFGLLAGGAATLGKMGGLAGKMSRLASSSMNKLATSASRVSGAVESKVATGLRATAQGLSYAAQGADVVAAGMGKVSHGLGAVDGIMSGQSVLTGAGRGISHMTTSLNKDGTLVRIPRNLQKAGMTAEEYAKLITKNEALDDMTRRSEAAKTLNLGTLTDFQAEQLRLAHNTGTSGMGKWDFSELRAKFEILTAKDVKGNQTFSAGQARVLLEYGYAGKIAEGIEEIATGTKKLIEKNTGVSRRGRYKQSDLLSDNEISLIEWDADIKAAEKSRLEKVTPEVESLSTIKDRKTMSNQEMKAGRFLEKQQDIAAMAREDKIREIRQLISEKFISQDGKKVGIGDTLHIDINGRKFIVGKEPSGKYRIMEEPIRKDPIEKKSPFYETGVIEYELGYKNATEVIRHLTDIAKKEYNAKLERLGVSHPEAYFGKRNQSVADNINTSVPEDTIATVRVSPGARGSATDDLVGVSDDTDLIPMGTKNGERRIFPDGEYRWSEKQQAWIGTDGKRKVPDKGDITEARKTEGAVIVSPQGLLTYRGNAIRTIDAIIPGAGREADEAIGALAKGDQSRLQDFLGKHWGKLLAAGALLALLSLAKCSGSSPDPDQPNPPLPANPNPGDIIEACKQCIEGPQSTINYKRKSAVNDKIMLRKDRREKISWKWTKTTEWKSVLQEWKQNEKYLSKEAKDAMNLVDYFPNVKDVQNLQHCIGMDANDDARGQDGILGPNTTRAIQAYILKCTVGKKS